MDLKFTGADIYPSGLIYGRFARNNKPEEDPKMNLNEQDMQDLIDLKKQKMNREKTNSFLYRQIGMVLSLGIVIMVFNWKSYDQAEIMDLGSVKNDFNEIMEIPISEQPPPPPPKIETFTIKEVKNTEEEIEELEVALDVELVESSSVEEVAYVEDVVEVEEEVVEEIFTVVEEQSEPIGGNAAFQKYLAENIEFPSKASRLGISGRVFVKFVVEKDGSLTDIQVVKGIGAGCNEEAIRVISKAPKWKPGKQRGKAVRTYRIIPINFILHNQ